MGQVEEWDRSRAADLAALVDAALPGEGLTVDEVLSSCWEAGGAVLGLADGSAAGAVVVGAPAGVGGEVPPGPPEAWVQLVVVDPAAQGAGLGGAVLAALEGRAAEAGAVAANLGGGPWALLPGVDRAQVRATALARSAGYRPGPEVAPRVVATAFRSPVPGGVELVRPLDDDVASLALGLARRWWPGWVGPVGRAVEQAGALVAVEGASGGAVGLVAHSVARAAWVGPVGVVPAWRRRGLGLALLGAACTDLMVGGFDQAVVAGPLPPLFLARARAVRWRSFRPYRKPLAGGGPPLAPSRSAGGRAAPGSR